MGFDSVNKSKHIFKPHLNIMRLIFKIKLDHHGQCIKLKQVITFKIQNSKLKAHTQKPI